MKLSTVIALLCAEFVAGMLIAITFLWWKWAPQFEAVFRHLETLR